MVNALSYTTISIVLDSWSKVQRGIKNYEEVAGVMLFKRFFRICPHAKVVFGFPIDALPTDLFHNSNKRFVKHATILIQMIETALNMLGPDIEMLTDIMTELGPKHVKYGVTTDMFPILGQCLIDTIAECLNDIEPGSFPSSTRDAWDEVYYNLSNDIVKAYNTAEKRKSSSKK